MGFCAFLSSILASGLCCSQAEPTPAPAQARAMKWYIPRRSHGTSRKPLGFFMTNYKLNVESSKIEVATGEVTARVIANFAWQHLKAATIFRDRVITLENEHIRDEFGDFFEEIRSYASACIMSSAASLEALINELFIAHNGALRSQINNFDDEFWGKDGIERKSILEKYKLALQMLKTEPLNERTSPFRDVWALIELRNALVHYKPTWDPDRQRKVELIEVLNGRFSVSPILDVGADFVSMKCMSAGCVKWAVSSSLAFMHEFHNRANLDSHKMEGFWKLET